MHPARIKFVGIIEPQDPNVYGNLCGIFSENLRSFSFALIVYISYKHAYIMGNIYSDFMSSLRKYYLYNYFVDWLWLC